MSNLDAATEAIASHLHPTASYNLADHALPTGKEEIWRFTPLEPLRPVLEGASADAELAWSGELPEQVSHAELSKEDVVAAGAQAPFDRVAAVALDHAAQSARIDIPAGLEVADPIVIDAVGRGGTVYGRTLVNVGAGASVTLVLRHRGLANYGELTNIVVGDGARLNFVSVQDWDDGAVHAGQHSILIGKDARVKSVTASLGGKLIRLMETAKYAGTGGELEQFGVYFADAGQHSEHRLFVDHNLPNTVSNVDYRGALQGEGANAVWIGDVLIRKVAQNISTYESNKNLLLTDGCRAESVPNLEIETGDIQGAGHSSTTGRFDDEQLFYLRSRGIPEAEARRLVVHGFFADIIRRIGVPEVEQRLLAVLEKELDAVGLPAANNEEN
ncbi:MAG: Fe-S cluster assembly protein SufD [Propionibacteriaceae bacterium]|jgi:Fe-S cluster assembly protein SufD|nr:Fe-S cluster assembly protein SufD [Propionibacteriaceae bacterium]